MSDEEDFEDTMIMISEEDYRILLRSDAFKQIMLNFGVEEWNGFSPAIEEYYDYCEELEEIKDLSETYNEKLGKVVH